MSSGRKVRKKNVGNGRQEDEVGSRVGKRPMMMRPSGTFVISGVRSNER